MTKDQIPPYRRVTLNLDTDGSYLAEYVWKRYRFLMSDGSTVDVVAARDDSDLRGAVLDVTKAERIEGVAQIDQQPVPTKKPSKRVAKIVPAEG